MEQHPLFINIKEIGYITLLAIPRDTLAAWLLVKFLCAGLLLSEYATTLTCKRMICLAIMGMLKYE